MEVTTTNFHSGSDLCAADLYLPKGVDRPPIMVMAHGFAGERSSTRCGGFTV